MLGRSRYRVLCDRMSVLTGIIKFFAENRVAKRFRVVIKYFGRMDCDFVGNVDLNGLPILNDL